MLSPQALAMLQNRRPYSTRPPEIEDPAKPKPGTVGGVLTGPGIYRPPGVVEEIPPGAAPPPVGTDQLARMQRMNAFRAQHAAFNAGRPTYGNNNVSSLAPPPVPQGSPVVGPPNLATPTPPAQPFTGIVANTNLPPDGRGTVGGPVPFPIPGPNHPANNFDPLKSSGSQGTDRGYAKNNGLKRRLGMI